MFIFFYDFDYLYIPWLLFIVAEKRT